MGRPVLHSDLPRTGRLDVCADRSHVESLFLQLCLGVGLGRADEGPHDHGHAPASLASLQLVAEAVGGRQKMRNFYEA